MYYVLVSDPYENSQDDIYSFADSIKEAREIGEAACAASPNGSLFLVTDAHLNVLPKEQVYRED